MNNSKKSTKRKNYDKGCILLRQRYYRKKRKHIFTKMYTKHLHGKCNCKQTNEFIISDEELKKSSALLYNLTHILCVCSCVNHTGKKL